MKYGSKVNPIVAREAFEFFQRNKDCGATIVSTAKQFRLPSKTMRDMWERMELRAINRKQPRRKPIDVARAEAER